MAELPTIKVFNRDCGTEMSINEADYNPELHEKHEDRKAAKKAAAAAAEKEKAEKEKAEAEAKRKAEEEAGKGKK